MKKDNAVTYSTLYNSGDVVYLLLNMVEGAVSIEKVTVNMVVITISSAKVDIMYTLVNAKGTVYHRLEEKLFESIKKLKDETVLKVKNSKVNK